MIALIIIIFIIGYFAIAFEHSIQINKAAPALITGVLCWTAYILFSPDKEHVNEQLVEGLGEYSGILFFLMGAMTIVEIIDTHDGFQMITKRIRTTSKRRLLWIISLLTFFLSPILDNLTTAIVMASLVQKIVQDPKDRLYYVGMIVIASNAGGAWSPIGDVTTTMLWLGGQITAANIIAKLLLPSLICLLVPLLLLSIRMKGNFSREADDVVKTNPVDQRRQWIIFLSGLFFLIVVPIFKTVTHLPPYMGILIGLGIMWIITEVVGGNKEGTERYKLSPGYALRKIDTPSILFFLGILLSIGALQATGVLTGLATWLDSSIGNVNLIVLSIGLLSAIVDNVPLVAASQGMYSLDQYPTDHYFWEFLAYSTGTGGSALIIGSAAGVAIMGIAKVDFFWYLKNISWVAIAGYLSGALCYILMHG
ncbi:MAG TPA: sodium:proton antiporter NhaD [Chitinophagaceae bacterium]|nr:sodium:proton antiporter NhaD [Chitinophagaceae bacterium]